MSQDTNNHYQVVPSEKAREGSWSKENRYSVWIKGEFLEPLKSIVPG